jgi:hypothetical protein
MPSGWPWRPQRGRPLLCRQWPLTPRLASWVRMLFILSSCLSFTTSDLLVTLLPMLEEQLVASRHEMEDARF